MKKYGITIERFRIRKALSPRENKNKIIPIRNNNLLEKAPVNRRHAFINLSE
jgi:hypothetical protein